VEKKNNNLYLGAWPLLWDAIWTPLCFFFLSFVDIVFFSFSCTTKITHFFQTIDKENGPRLSVRPSVRSFFCSTLLAPRHATPPMPSRFLFFLGSTHVRLFVYFVLFVFRYLGRGEKETCFAGEEEEDAGGACCV
jgi:hypothetical protein